MLAIVSVLIPTYNRKDLLKIALESVLHQDYPHLEIIISDNASTDGTEEFVKSYNDPRIKYIQRSENIGAGRNFQEGFKDCTGKYFFCLNDDDFLTNMSYFSKAVKAMEENPNVSLVRSIVNIYHHDTHINEIYAFNTKKIINGVEFFLNYYQKGYENFVCWFCLVRREDIVNAGGIQNHFAADVLMNLSACLYGDVYFLPELIAQYNIYSNQASNNLDLMNSSLDLPYILEDLLAKSKHDIPSKQIKKTVNYLGERFIYGSMKIAYKKQNKLKKFRQILKQSRLKKDYPMIYYTVMVAPYANSDETFIESLKFPMKALLKKIITLIGR